MKMFLNRSLAYRSLSSVLTTIITISLIFPAQLTYANPINLPPAGTMLTPSAAYVPTLIRGITIFPENPLQFDFIVDNGDTSLQGEALKAEATKLIKYFLASLTVPKEDLWVNLSPYEKDRIIPDGFGQTEMGRDLLAQDYVLKQLTASLIYPEQEIGKEFWSKVYAKAQDLYGTTDIPLDTFNKVWVIPDNATVYEKDTTAFVINSHLKVMLEEDYLATQNKQKKATSSSMSPVIKEVVLPAIEKEVNEGKNFANLRQVYNSMILAIWYKQNLKQSLLGQVYVDKNKTKGVDVEDKQMKQKIYEKYLEAFKKGAYDYIKEDYDPKSQQIIDRKYFSGGFTAKDAVVRDINYASLATISDTDRAAIDHASVAQGDVTTDRVILVENADAASVAMVGMQYSSFLAKSVLGDRRFVDAFEKIKFVTEDSDHVVVALNYLVSLFNTAQVPSRREEKIFEGSQYRYKDILPNGAEGTKGSNDLSDKTMDALVELISNQFEDRAQLSETDRQRIQTLMAAAIESPGNLNGDQLNPLVNELASLFAKIVRPSADSITADDVKIYLQLIGIVRMFTQRGQGTTIRRPAVLIAHALRLDSSDKNTFRNYLFQFKDPSWPTFSTVDRSNLQDAASHIMNKLNLKEIGLKLQGDIVSLNLQSDAASVAKSKAEEFAGLEDEQNRFARRIAALQSDREALLRKLEQAEADSKREDSTGETRKSYLLAKDNFFAYDFAFDRNLDEEDWKQRNKAVNLLPKIHQANLKVEQAKLALAEAVTHESVVSASTDSVSLEAQSQATLDKEQKGEGLRKASEELSKFSQDALSLYNHFRDPQPFFNPNADAAMVAEDLAESVYDKEAFQEILRFTGKDDLLEQSQKQSVVDYLAGLFLEAGIKGLSATIPGTEYQYSNILSGPLGNINSVEDLSDHNLDILGALVKQQFPKGQDAAQLAEPLAPWVKVNVPDFRMDSLVPFGLHVESVEVALLKPQQGATADTVLNDADTSKAVAISVSQALGSDGYAGEGKEAKEVADANAVFMGHQQVVATVKQNAQTGEKKAYANLASEGIRDSSVADVLGQVASNNHPEGLDSADKDAYESQILGLRREGVQVIYKLDDGLENTNALKDGKKDAWAVVALQYDRGDGPVRYLLDETDTRRVSVMANAPTDAKITALDSPRQVLQKLAAANGIENLDSDAGRAFAKKITMAILGDRAVGDQKSSSGKRHVEFYIKEMQELEKAAANNIW